MRVLIIEDEARLARNVARVLREEADFAVDVSPDGVDGWHMASGNPYDLIVLDLMLPGKGGLEILKGLRAAGKGTPVLVLTALDKTSDVVRGLDLGCDDYVTKPFEMGELVARCKALIRRAYDRPDPEVAVGELRVNTASRTASLAGRPLTLTAMEYRLLEYLAMRAGQVVSKTDILEHLYDFDSERFSNVVEVYISGLRKKLDIGGEASMVRTIRGLGYVLGGQRA